MLRLMFLATILICCRSFLVPLVPSQSRLRIGTHWATSNSVYRGQLLSMSTPLPPRCPSPLESHSAPLDRRTLLENGAVVFVPAVLGAVSASIPRRTSAAALRNIPKPVSKGTRVVVLGGNGFVGSKVCEVLVEAGADVISLSRSGSKPDKWAPAESWVDKVSWQVGDPTAADLSLVFSKATAVISCVGVIGGSDQEMARGNGDVNVAAASQAAKANVGRFVYVSVSPLVREAFGGLVLNGYFDGKTRAEEAIAKSFPSTGTLIQPAFIYGGDSFELTPPRVSDAYGAGIDALLSSSPIRAIAGISPGPIKVALSPPVSRENVALACVAGALGRLEGTTFDGADEINAAAKKA